MLLTNAFNYLLSFNKFIISIVVFVITINLKKVYIENTKYFLEIVFIEGIDDGKV